VLKNRCQAPIFQMDSARWLEAATFSSWVEVDELAEPHVLEWPRHEHPAP
jgi:hypothetical protein